MHSYVLSSCLNHSISDPVVSDTLFATWARGGEGALAPSCRAPQGYDETSEIILFYSTCGRRKSSKCPLATELRRTVASRLLPGLRRPQVEKNEKLKFRWSLGFVIAISNYKRLHFLENVTYNLILEQDCVHSYIIMINPLPILRDEGPCEL